MIPTPHTPVMGITVHHRKEDADPWRDCADLLQTFIRESTEGGLMGNVGCNSNNSIFCSNIHSFVNLKDLVRCFSSIALSQRFSMSSDLMIRRPCHKFSR